MNNKITFTVSKRGGKMIIYKYHLYNFDRLVHEKNRWRCHNRACRGFIYTDIENKTILREKDHDHGSSIPEISAKKIKDNISADFLNTDELFNDIFLKNIQGIDNEVLESLPLPMYDNLRDSVMRRKMNKIMNKKKYT
ncbi:hypothetical protein DMUE_5394, partial [Dictyocoela muelleri]